jgi:poly-gamma-glutamate capsule biosynthesis protein CapA/YwtB (metallophosphatase superfamily)
MVPRGRVSPTVGLLGDVMLGRGVARRLGEVAPERLWSDEVAALCAECRAVICNLECCISDRGSPTERIPGKRFFFRAPSPAVQALTAAGVRGVSLANNHALDYGVAALADTLAGLSAAGIAAAGAGPDADRARRGAVVAANGFRVGLLAVTDHPVEYAATQDSPGVAMADLTTGLPDWIPAEIARLRDQADVVVAFPHWGPNMTTKPARWQRRCARALIDAGADLVAGHSAHVFHGIERIEDRFVLYDLGDALDDYVVDRRLRNDLGILTLWRPDCDPQLELVALRLGFCETSVARGADADWIASRLAKASAKLGTRVERVTEERLVVQP